MGQDQSLPENHQVSHTNRARSLSPLPRDAEENSDDAAQFPATQPIPKKSKFLESPVAESGPADPMASPESRPRHRKRREDREDRRRRRSESFSATQPAADLERPSPSQEAEARPSTQPEFSEVKKKKKNKKKSKRHSLASQAVEEETSILESNPIPESPTIAPHSSLFAALKSSHQALQVNLEEQEQEQDHARPDFLDNFRAKSFGSGKKKRRSSQGSETSGVMASSSLKKRDKEARKSNRRVDELERNQSDHTPAVMAKAPLPEDEDETMDYSRREEIDEEMDEDMPAGLPSFTQRSFLGANDPGSPVISESSLPELPRPIDNDQNVEYLDNYPEHSGDEEDEDEEEEEHEEEQHEEEEHEEAEPEEEGADDSDRGDIGFGSPDLSRHKEREMSQVLDEDLSTKNIKATRRSPTPPASPEHAAEPDPVPPSSSARAPGSQSSRRLKKKVPFFERENQETSNLPSDPAADEADAPPHQLESSQPKSSRLKKQKKTRSEPRPEIIPESDIEETSVISKTQITNGGGSSQRSAPKSSQPSLRKSRPQPPPEISPVSDIDEADAAPEAPTADGRRSSQRSTQKSSQKSSRKSKKSAPVVASSADDTKGHDESDSTGEREGGNERPTQASQYRTGVMTKSEITKIKRAIERFREDEGMTQTEVNTIIHENPQSKVGVKEVHQRLWARVVEACTTRPRKKLILWCRKNFHNFVARGRWTEEQDDELVELVKAHGNSWVKIASIINRHQDDVRDRWRNYLVCRDTVITDQWSVEEEERLTAAVENAIKKIQAKLDEQGKRDVSAEELVSWGLISDEMGRTRSRLQCQEKWKRLSMAEPIADREQVVTLLPPGNNGWRIKKARRDLRRIDLADKNKLVCAIRDSGAEHERDIVWKTIVTETFEKNYERQALVVVWGRLKQSVPDFKQKTVNQCAKQLAKMYRNEGNFGNQQQYDDGESSGDDATNRTRRNNSGNRPNSLKNSKSKLKSAAEVKKIKTPAEAISDEEDEEEEQGEMSVDNQDQEMEDAPPRTTPEVNDVSQLSPTFSSVPVSDSPSVAAEASRSRRRERSASVTASVAAATATVIAAPSPQRSKSKSRGKSRERQRRDRESDAVAAAPPKSPERPEPSTQEIPSSVKRSGKKRRLSSSGANGELWTGASVKKRERAAKKRMRLMKEVDTTGLSSDMDDMEDIPARTQESSQVL